MENLIAVKEKWVNKYPNTIKSWEDNWDNLSKFLFFLYIGKLFYTTNVIESLNSQFRKITKTKLIFLTYDHLLKMLYLAIEVVHSKWIRSYSNWDLIINEFKIIFSDIFSKGAKKL